MKQKICVPDNADGVCVQVEAGPGPEGDHQPQPGGEGVEVAGQEGAEGGAVVGAVLLRLAQPVHQQPAEAAAGSAAGRGARSGLKSC